MSKVAVMLAEGFEEGEALTIVDIIRRAGIQCDIFSINGLIVKGAHDINVQADYLISDEICNYDMVVLPGGLPGAANLRDNDHLIGIIRKMNEEKKFVCAMCAAPIVLDRAEILEGKEFTAYLGYDDKIKADGIFKEDLVVRDGNIITSRGPATAYHFAYGLVDALGVDSSFLKERMLFNLAYMKDK